MKISKTMATAIFSQATFLPDDEGLSISLLLDGRYNAHYFVADVCKALEIPTNEHGGYEIHTTDNNRCSIRLDNEGLKALYAASVQNSVLEAFAQEHNWKKPKTVQVPRR